MFQNKIKLNPKKKKKKEEIDIFSYLKEDEKDEDYDCPISKDQEFIWFVEYLKINQGIGSNEASKLFWLDKKDSYPNCFKMVQKYRSILCTSIFEEQLFSVVGKIATEDCTSLKDKTIDEMLFYKKNKMVIFPQNLLK